PSPRRSLPPHTPPFRSRKSTQLLDLFALIHNTQKIIRYRGDNLFAGQCTTPAFDHLALGVNFVGPVDIPLQTLHLIQIENLNPMSLQPLCRTLRTRDSPLEKVLMLS